MAQGIDIGARIREAEEAKKRIDALAKGEQGEQQKQTQEAAKEPQQPVRVLRSLPRYQDRALRSLQSVRDIDDKCELLLTWLQRLREEAEGPANRATFLDMRRAAALYRDEDFVQLFGLPFDQATVKWRTDLHEEVIARCEGVARPSRGLVSQFRRPVTEFAARFNEYRAVLDGPFLGQAGLLSPDAVSRTIGAARQSRSWMESAISALVSVPAAPASFRDLDARAADAQRQLAVLWPSEQRHFRDVVEQRRREVAVSITDSWLTEIESASAGLDSVRLLIARQDQNSEALRVLPAAEADRVQNRLNGKVDSLLAPLVDARVAELAAMPVSLAGAAPSLAWKTSFERDFAGVQRPAVVAARSQYATVRQRLFAAGLPEWQTTVGLTPLEPEAIQLQARRLGELFESDERGSAAYREYQQAITARTDALRQLESARQAEAARVEAARLESERLAAAKAAEAERRAEEARLDVARKAELKAAAARLASINAERAKKGLPALKASCDDLAAHPDDPGKGAVTGVADTLISTESAIGACLVAAAETPSSARLQFQLGRAYWAGKRYDEAVNAFLVAEELNYAPAYYYLGLAYEEGRIEGEMPDLAAASEMYMIAASEGFTPAIDAYQGIEWDWNVDWSSLSNPSLARAIDGYTPGQVPQVGRRELLAYIAGINSFLSLSPNEFDTTCASMVKPQVTTKLQEMGRAALGLSPRSSSTLDDLAQIFQRTQSMTLNDVFAQANDNARLEGLVQAGTDDVYALVADYGGCSGTVVKKFYENVGAVLFAVDGGATSVQPGSLEAGCLDHMNRVNPGAKSEHVGYCSCIERQYRSVFTAQERQKYTADYQLFVKEVISANPAAKEPSFDWRLYTAQNACRK
jgi:TPR repeat protein